jgi:hypothetical protein
MKWICLIAGALVMASSAMCSQATESAACPVPSGAVKVALPSGLPPALRDAMGDVALPGEQFDKTDVYIKGHKHRCYIFVWNIGSRWIVATENGGIALRAEVSTYKFVKDGKTAALLKQRFTFPENACSLATKLSKNSKR